MITEEENKLLAQTNKGTPCGELMRRYWQPAVLSEELTADKPLPVTILGEELILFREADGKPALIGRWCAHQGVDMVYGRVEADGLRCMYHGWMFDRCGKVVIRGEWLPEKERRWDVGQPAHPCVEEHGIIFTWMGSEDAPPLDLANLVADKWPETCSKIAHEENYLRPISSIAVQNAGAKFLMPNLIVLPGGKTAAELHWFVPTDDNSHAQFTVPVSQMPQITALPLAAAPELLVEAVRKVELKGP